MIHFQVIDTPKTTVVEYQNIYLLLFLHNGHNLAVEHLEAGITHHAVHLRIRISKFNAQGGRHLVSHAGISVLRMVSAPFIRGPHSLHTAGKGTACGNNHRIFVNGSANCRKSRCLCDFSLRKLYKFRNGSGISGFDHRLEILSGIGDAGQTLHFLIPDLFRLYNFRGISGMISHFAQLLSQSLYCGFRVTYRFHRIHFICMESAVIDGDKLHIFILEEMFGACGKVRHTGTDGNYHIRILPDHIGRIGSGDADTAQAVGMAGHTCTFPCLCLTEGNPELCTELLHFFPCVGIPDAAAHNDQRFPGFCYHPGRILQLFFHRRRPGDSVYSLRKKVLRIVKGFPFYILGKSDTAGSCLRRVCENSHCVDQRRHNHLRSGHAVPVFADRFKRVIRGNRQRGALLQLLQHRVRLSGGKSIRREYQQRNVVYRGSGTGCHHIGCAGPHGRRTGDDFFPLVLLRECNSRMAHSLLIPSLHDPQPAGLTVQSFSQPYCDTMPENGKKSFYKFRLFSVHGYILIV